jgi:hypothetical protein
MTTNENYVWVTFINNKNYLDGAHVLAKSLEEVHSKYELIIFYPIDFVIEKNNKLRNITYVPIKQLIYESKNHSISNYIYCINKIYIWILTQYSKVCWVDSDMIFLHNSDDIFNCEIEDGQISAASGCTCNIFNNNKLPSLPNACPFNNSNNIYINTGILLIKPNINIYKLLLDANYDYPLPEQDAFNIIFKNKIKVIHSKYNYINNLEFAHPTCNQQINIFHFAYGKPWDTDKLSHTYNYIYDLWHKYKQLIK